VRYAREVIAAKPDYKGVFKSGKEPNSLNCFALFVYTTCFGLACEISEMSAHEAYSDETVFRFFHQARHSAGWAVSVFSKCGRSNSACVDANISEGDFPGKL